MYCFAGAMTNAFTSERQKQLYHAVLSHLRGIGYTRELLQEDYQFNDWFVTGCPSRSIPAAAFAQTPFSYDTACFGVFLSANGTSGGHVTRFRSLGAPLVFEVREDGVVPWRVGRDVGNTISHARIPPESLNAAFRDQRKHWLPESVLRAKNIGAELGPRQLEFIDLGLIPALEREVSNKLDYFLRDVLQTAQRVYRRNAGIQPDTRKLFRLVFRLLAAKVLRDRNVAGFRNLDDGTQAGLILRRVSRYYRERLPVLEDAATQIAVAERLWQQVSFQNLSVEVLAYIYENTLVDPSIREHLGIHSTPASIARYIVHRLPLAEIPENERVIVEPCSGHGIFLVAALKRLRDLLPKGMDAQARHRYFVKMLHGFERDAFAIEVSKLCLMLADFPNHNGWRIQKADVFSSSKFTRALTKARIVLCNPPFEDFLPAERRKYQHLSSVQKPVEVLRRVLTNLSPNALLGFVLPRQFISGKGYDDVRSELTRRFRELEVVALPDRVFRHSLLETSLLIGRVVGGDSTTTTVSFVEVKDRDRTRFLEEHAGSRHDLGHKTSTEAARSFLIPALNEVWDRLANNPRLRDVTEIHRGVEWQQPFDEKKYLSAIKKPGFVRGLNSAEGEFFSFQAPKPVYLCSKAAWRQYNAWDLPWDKPKVVMNAIRVSRGPWKIAAFSEEQGLVCTANFQCLWPRAGWGTKTLSAILNGPVASGYVAAHEASKHILKDILAEVPLPLLDALQVSTLEGLVEQYVSAVIGSPDSRLELWNPVGSPNRARRVLLEIDAIILKGYNLPPRLERELLDFFRDEKRPVPFEFGDYFPEDFTPTIPLWMYISEEFQKCTAGHLLKTIPKITDPVLIEALSEVE